MTAETRRFDMHPKLLLDVIKRQAGTLSKAVLEGVMNAIDAKATKIEVIANPKSITIADDGHGFRSREEIETFFEVFGQPHDGSENKRYGTFRMGRGQMMAFGANHWRTGQFEMLVDINEKGFDYDLKKVDKPFPGCRIDITLYDPLDRIGLRDLEDQLRALVKWACTPVILNGENLSQDPAEEKWDHEDDAAYYSFREIGTLTIYNLGVQAHSHSAHTYGVGGEVVSKKQLKLNFARNDVMSDCPVWKTIRAVLNANSKKLTTKKTLNDYERGRLAKQLINGELCEDENDYEGRRDIGKLNLFTDVHGRHFSLGSMMQKSYRYRDKCTVAPKGDAKGDALMVQRIALVFAQETLDRFGVKTLDALLKRVIMKYYAHCRLEAVAYDDLTANMDDTITLIDPNEYTPIEKAMLDTIDRGQRFAIERMAEPRAARRILLGISADGADATTDGEHSVTFGREFLRECGSTPGGWVQIGACLLHELCHGESDCEDVGHGQAFYTLYHDSHEFLAAFVETALRSYEGYLKSAGKRLTKQQLAVQSRLENSVAAEQPLAVHQTQGEPNNA